MGKLSNFVDKIKQTPFIKSIINDLNGEVYLVGGAVRDLILNKPNKDIDIVVRKIPIDNLIHHLQNFGKSDVVGKSFGVIKFIDGSGIDYDIALPRKEQPTGEGGYHGFTIQSDPNLSIGDDLIRRDAKMNAMAININTGEFIDPLGGLEDIKQKQISAANPKAFKDDPLRMLRIIGFASRFNFNIENETFNMIQQNANRIKEIPSERFLIEFDKIVKKGNIRYGVQLLKETGLFKQMFGYDINQQAIDRNPYGKVKTMGEFIYLLLQSMQNPAKYFKNNLKGDLTSYKEIIALQSAMTDTLNGNILPIKARSIAHNTFLQSPQALQSQILPQVIRQAGQELLTGKYPKTIGELQVNGNDLMQLGLKGKEIGDTLKMMLLKVYNDQIKNNKKELLSIVSNNKLIEVKKKNISYSAVVLDNKSRKKLLDMFDRVIPEGWKIVADHMTIKLGELDSKEDLGKKVELFVRDYAINDKVTAVGVSGYNSDNKKQHITLAVNTAAGGKPKDSNLLTGWKRIGFKLKLTGRVEEVELPLTQLNEGISKYSKEKQKLMRSKSISKEMKEEILKYFGGGSTYHMGGRVHGLNIPKVKGKSFKGVSLGADKKGFYVYTHRAASKRYESPDKIPMKDIKFIESTG